MVASTNCHNVWLDYANNLGDIDVPESCNHDRTRCVWKYVRTFIHATYNGVSQ